MQCFYEYEKTKPIGSFFILYANVLWMNVKEQEEEFSGRFVERTSAYPLMSKFDMWET